jgi:hypothetical protein
MSQTEGVGDQEPSEDWYEPAIGDLEQGDLLLNFPAAIPTLADDGQIEVLRRNASVLVLTQTCDIPKRAQKTLLLVQAVDYQEALQRGQDHLASKEYRKALATGTAVSDLLLPPDTGGRIRYMLVNFRSLLVLPKSYVSTMSDQSDRLRLRSPYKEHFAQAYARFMMRVGLPYTLHGFLEQDRGPRTAR